MANCIIHLQTFQLEFSFLLVLRTDFLHSNASCIVVYCVILQFILACGKTFKQKDKIKFHFHFYLH